MADETTPLAQAYQAYERMEGQLSVALEKLVATNGFADLLATSATNVMALTRLANGTIDRFVRTTRLAARHDVTELARQLARTEAKLEKLLQVVEHLQDQLIAAEAERAVPSATAPPLATPVQAPPEPPGDETGRNGTARNGTARNGTARNGTVSGGAVSDGTARKKTPRAEAT